MKIMPTKEELATGIIDLLEALYITDCCHSCVYNSDDSEEIIALINKSADIIDLPAKDRWWL
jgi:hypothetical protein